MNRNSDFAEAVERARKRLGASILSKPRKRDPYSPAAQFVKSANAVAKQISGIHSFMDRQWSAYTRAVGTFDLEQDAVNAEVEKDEADKAITAMIQETRQNIASISDLAKSYPRARGSLQMRQHALKIVEILEQFVDDQVQRHLKMKSERVVNNIETHDASGIGLLQSAEGTEDLKSKKKQRAFAGTLTELLARKDAHDRGEAYDTDEEEAIDDSGEENDEDGNGDDSRMSSKRKLKKRARPPTMDELIKEARDREEEYFRATKERLKQESSASDTVINSGLTAAAAHVEEDHKQKAKTLSSPAAQQYSSPSASSTQNDTDIQRSVQSTPVVMEELHRQHHEDNIFQAAPLSKEDEQMLVEENQALLEELQARSNEVDRIQKSIMEIAHLQEVFTSHVIKQAEQLDNMQTDTIVANENVMKGNEYIQKAIDTGVGFRIWALTFIMILSFCLLFLDWFHS
eukprot:Clim_evm78s146 gene=Clim_evmTU78s146